MISGAALAVEWQQLRANAHRLGYTDEQIDAAVVEWRKTPYDRDELWRMLTSKGPNDA